MMLVGALVADPSVPGWLVMASRAMIAICAAWRSSDSRQPTLLCWPGLRIELIRGRQTGSLGRRRWGSGWCRKA